MTEPSMDTYLSGIPTEDDVIKLLTTMATGNIFSYSRVWIEKTGEESSESENDEDEEQEEEKNSEADE